MDLFMFTSMVLCASFFKIIVKVQDNTGFALKFLGEHSRTC
jgi:hypothetical protein